MTYSPKKIFTVALVAASFAALYKAADVTTSVNIPEGGAPPLVYANQDRDDLTKAYLQSIDSAKTSVLLLIYNLSDPSMIYALREKSAQGVKVRVVCDGKATPNAKKRLGANVEVFPYHEGGLMHLKILVVDNELILLGSANLSRQSLRIHGNLVMGFTSKEAASFITERADVISSRNASREVGPQREFFLAGQKLELWFLPNPNIAVDKIINMIRSARKSIRVAMFTWTRADFAEACVHARLRGVKVKVAMDKNASRGTCQKIARLFHREKVPLRVNTDMGLLHHKCMIIDDETLVMGSANWTQAAFTKNQDCFVVLHDLTEKQKAKVKRAWKAISADSEKYR